MVVKEAMNLMGHPAGICRRPIQPLSEVKRAELAKILTGMGLLSEAAAGR